MGSGREKVDVTDQESRVEKTVRQREEENSS
jgi:hypothetical protein